jgi:hypothetical protein
LHMGAIEPDSSSRPEVDGACGAAPSPSGP